MNKKQPKRVKHIPQRTCIGCRTVLSKRDLTRIVRTEKGVFVDPSGRVAGRGAYVHNNRSCWEQAIKGPIYNALRGEITEEDRERLRDFISRLPNDDHSAPFPQKNDEKGK